jgi:hypothetical protein
MSADDHGSKNSVTIFSGPGTPTSGAADLRTIGEQLHIAEGKGPYVWIKSYETYNMGDNAYGIVADWEGPGGGGTNASPAINAFFRMVAASNKRARVVIPPSWAARCRDPIIIPPMQGFSMEGADCWNSTFAMDPAIPNDHGLIIQSGQLHNYANFGFTPALANPVDRMITLDNTVPGYSQYGHIFYNILLGAGSGPGCAYGDGFYFTVGPGGNSDMKYIGCKVYKFAGAAFHLTGTQQYAHSWIYGDINGNWDGIDHTDAASGGMFGFLLDNGGSFTFRDGGVSAIRGACFNGGTAELPCVIDNCDTEVAYQVIGDGNSSPPAPTAGGGNIVYTNSRFSNNANSNMDPSKVIIASVSGQATITGNDFFNGGTNLPKIMVVGGGVGHGVRIHNNTFESRGSVSSDPVVISGIAVNIRASVDIRDNTYMDSGGNIAQRDEILNVPVTDAGAVLASPAAAQISTQLQVVDLTTFNAAAPFQDVEIRSAQPNSITYDAVIAQLYNYIVTAGGVAITMRVGTTSGGQELIKDFVVGDSGVGDWPKNAGLYGATAAQRGTDMPGVCPNVTGTSSIWVRLTAASGNLGDGVTSIITRGIINLVIRAYIQFRFIAP